MATCTRARSWSAADGPSRSTPSSRSTVRWASTSARYGRTPRSPACAPTGSDRPDGFRAHVAAIVRDSWEAFTDELATLWPERVDPFFGRLPRALAARAIWHDAVGFAATKAIRRMIGFAHVADIETLDEPARFAAAGGGRPDRPTPRSCERAAITARRRCWTLVAGRARACGARIPREPGVPGAHAVYPASAIAALLTEHPARSASRPCHWPGACRACFPALDQESPSDVHVPHIGTARFASLTAISLFVAACSPGRRRQPERLHRALSEAPSAPAASRPRPASRPPPAVAIPAPFDAAPVQVALVRQLGSGDYFEQWLAGAEAQADEAGDRAADLGRPRRQRRQATNLETAINQGVKAIIIDHGQTETLTPGIEKALAANIPVVAFDANANNPKVPPDRAVGRPARPAGPGPARGRHGRRG